MADRMGRHDGPDRKGRHHGARQEGASSRPLPAHLHGGRRSRCARSALEEGGPRCGWASVLGGVCARPAVDGDGLPLRMGFCGGCGTLSAWEVGVVRRAPAACARADVVLLGARRRLPRRSRRRCARIPLTAWLIMRSVRSSGGRRMVSQRSRSVTVPGLLARPDGMSNGRRSVVGGGGGVRLRWRVSPPAARRGRGSPRRT